MTKGAGQPPLGPSWRFFGTTTDQEGDPLFDVENLTD